MSNNIYPLQKLTAYWCAHFLNAANGHMVSSANHMRVYAFCGVKGGLIPAETFQAALIDKAIALEIAAQRFRTAAAAVEIGRQEPLGKNTIEGVEMAWEQAEQEAVNNVL